MKDVEYDQAGNVETFAGHRYAYDEANIVKREDGGAMAREFIYNADDERLTTYTVGGEWKWTIRDLSGRVLRELTSNSSGSQWTWTKDYVYRDGVLLASRHASINTPVTHHYHVDHLGTPRRVTDHLNRIVGFHDYFAFGPEVAGGLSEPNATSLQYTGHERDRGAGAGGLDTLDYMHARYYSPHLGRFLTIDREARVDQSSPQTWNLYSYVGNDPIGHLDPDGNNRIVYWVMGKANHYWRQVERKVARRGLRRSTKDNPHNVQVEGPSSSQKAQSLVEEAFPGQQTTRHDAHTGGPSNPMDRHKPHHQTKKARKQGGGQVNYAEIIKGVASFIPYIGWAVDADAAATSDAAPHIEQRAQELFGASFYDLEDDERKEVWRSLMDEKKDERKPPPCPKGKIPGTSGPCD